MPLSPTPDGAGATAEVGAEAVAEPSSFEAAYRELQQVVAKLEAGGRAGPGMDLERAVRLFERGSHLVQVCERFIDDAELRVTRLAAESASPLADAPAEP
jgi:exodeoxyribonuclease VII small subunit